MSRGDVDQLSAIRDLGLRSRRIRLRRMLIRVPTLTIWESVLRGYTNPPSARRQFVVLIRGAAKRRLQNTALRLPKRLTFGLRIDLSLSEPASTLGGPVAAVTTADVRDPDSGLRIPSGTIFLFETASNNISGRVAVDWTRPARLLFDDYGSISFRGYVIAEDGPLDLPALPLGRQHGGGEFKRLAQGFLAGQAVCRKA